MEKHILKKLAWLYMACAMVMPVVVLTGCSDDDDEGGEDITSTEETTQDDEDSSNENSDDEDSSNENSDDEDSSNIDEISSATGTDENGFEYVDLGLTSGLYWARTNIRDADYESSTPGGSGNHYAWGDTITKTTYQKSCRTYNIEIDDFSGDPKYDVATYRRGGHWRMPTKDEFQELINECECEWTTYKSAKGYKFTGPNGNSIFIKAAGGEFVATLTNVSYTKYVGTYGYYWSSTPSENDDGYAYSLKFGSSSVGISSGYVRYNAHYVRAVYDEDFEYE